MASQGDRLLAAEDDTLSVDSSGGKRRCVSDRYGKYVVLAIYSYITANQSLLWMTWSSVPDVSRAYLGTTDDVLDLWLDWGPVAFLCSVFAASWLLSSYRHGLHLSIRIAAVLCFLAAVLRCLPILFSDDDIHGQYNGAVLSVIHVCQFLNGAAAPFVVASPAYLSLLWFPEEQRNAATAVANTANALGRGVGFFLGPALVQTASDMPTLLLVEVGLALLPLIAAFTILPPWPAVPPSRAAREEAARWDVEEDRRLAAEINAEEEAGLLQSLSDGSGGVPVKPNSSGGVKGSARTLLAEVWTSLCTPAFVFLCIAGGLEMAIYGAWSGVLPSALTGTGKYDDAQAGWFGTVNTFAGIGGGILAGMATDWAPLRRRLVGVVVVLLLAATVCFGLVAAALPPLAFATLTDLTGSYAGLLVLCGLAGLLRGGTDPLFFELAAEAVADKGVPAGTAGGILTFWYHLILCLLLSVPAAPLQTGAMPAMAVCLAGAALLMAPVRVRYTRR